MKIAIISPYATVAPHFETELEIAQRHLDAGDDVEYLACRGGLANCEYNPEKTVAGCQSCVLRRNNGLGMLEPSEKSSFLESDIFSIEGSTVTKCVGQPTGLDVKANFHSLAELKRYELDGFDLGYAALSSLVSITRDPDPDIQVEHQSKLQRILHAAWQTYEGTTQYLQENRPDRVYVFNGRFANMRAVLRACQKLQVDCFVHERGCDMFHYDLFQNHLPHDIEKVKERMRKLWADAVPEEREKIGASWFEERVQRVEKSWYSFVKHQEAGRLPEEFDPTQQNVAIFTSSDDEFESIGDQWENPIYGSQLAGVKAVVSSLQEVAPEIRVFLRVHPNLKNTENERKRQTLAMDSPNLTIIGPEAPLDSYALLRAADKVVTFGSSIGIESVYWGTPSILLGPCFYQSLGGTYTPQTHEEAIDLLLQALSPLDRTGALVYGFWLQSKGIPFEDFVPNGLFSGLFKGQEITAEAPREKLNFIQKIRRESKRVLRQMSGIKK